FPYDYRHSTDLHPASFEAAWDTTLQPPCPLPRVAPRWAQCQHASCLWCAAAFASAAGHTPLRG
ncbi:dynein heavy chain, putative, partial [Trypanosoma vivax Y486]